MARQSPTLIALAAARKAGFEALRLGRGDKWLKAREADVTASAAGCLMGVHDYFTPFSYYALKAKLVDDNPEETPAMLRGKLLEPVAVELLRKQKPSWTVERSQTYFRDPAARLGASPDVLAHDPEREGFGIVQIKSVEASIFRTKWRTEDGEINVPLWIAVQGLVEAYLTGASWALVAPLVVSFGIDQPLIDVPIHAGVIERLKNEVRHFWWQIDNKKPPPINFRRDADLVDDLFGEGEDRIENLTGDNEVLAIVNQRERLSGIQKEAKADLSEIKTHLLTKLNGARRGLLSDGRMITANRVKRKGYSVEASEYIDLRIRKAAAGT